MLKWQGMLSTALYDGSMWLVSACSRGIKRWLNLNLDYYF